MSNLISLKMTEFTCSGEKSYGFIISDDYGKTFIGEMEKMEYEKMLALKGLEALKLASNWFPNTEATFWQIIEANSEQYFLWNGEDVEIPVNLLKELT